jgi:hypothetical protein
MSMCFYFYFLIFNWSVYKRTKESGARMLNPKNKHPFTRVAIVGRARRQKSVRATICPSSPGMIGRFLDKMKQSYNIDHERESVLYYHTTQQHTTEKTF